MLVLRSPTGNQTYRQPMRFFGCLVKIYQPWPITSPGNSVSLCFSLFLPVSCIMYAMTPWFGTLPVFLEFRHVGYIPRMFKLLKE